MDGTKPCANCPHPRAEHTADDGACKVPGCDCTAYQIAERMFAKVDHGVPTADEKAKQLNGKHTLLARATDAEGNEGLEYRLPDLPGGVLTIEQEEIEKAGHMVKAQFEHIFGAEPAHVGVVGLPYLANADDKAKEVATPVIETSGEIEPEEAVETLKTIEKIGCPVEQMPLHQQLAYELRDISGEAAARALNGHYKSRAVQEQLADWLAQQTGTPAAYVLASRLRGGQFVDD